MTPFTLPPGYIRIKLVKSFHELVTTPFEGGVNTLCWQRTLSGNFSEVVEHLGVSEGIATLDETPTDHSAFTLSKPTNGWPIGKYRVEIYVNDKLAETLKFTISKS